VGFGVSILLPFLTPFFAELFQSHLNRQLQIQGLYFAIYVVFLKYPFAFELSPLPTSVSVFLSLKFQAQANSTPCEAWVGSTKLDFSVVSQEMQIQYYPLELKQHPQDARSC
jgi:hypothetical protein